MNIIIFTLILILIISIVLLHNINNYELETFKGGHSSHEHEHEDEHEHEHEHSNIHNIHHNNEHIHNIHHNNEHIHNIHHEKEHEHKKEHKKEHEKKPSHSSSSGSSGSSSSSNDEDNVDNEDNVTNINYANYANNKNKINLESNDYEAIGKYNMNDYSNNCESQDLPTFKGITNVNVKESSNPNDRSFNILSDLEMQSISIFKEFNPATWRQFYKAVRQYNYLRKFHPDTNDQLLILNNRILELFDDLTFGLPYRELEKVSVGMRYDLRQILAKDRMLLQSYDSNTAYNMMNYRNSWSTGADAKYSTENLPPELHTYWH